MLTLFLPLHLLAVHGHVVVVFFVAAPPSAPGIPIVVVAMCSVL